MPVNEYNHGEQNAANHLIGEALAGAFGRFLEFFCGLYPQKRFFNPNVSPCFTDVKNEVNSYLVNTFRHHTLRFRDGNMNDMLWQNNGTLLLNLNR